MRKRIIMMIMGGALIALPALAQGQDWKSTSAMQTSGSAYTPQVTEVGATAVAGSATTTESYSPAKAPNGPRRTIEDDKDPGQLDDGSPIGDAVLPLLLMSLAFCGYLYLRRKKRAEA